MEQVNVFTLELTAATVIDGEIAVAGEIVELSKAEAENLLGRGMGRLVDAAQLADIQQQAQDEAEQLRLQNEAQLVAQIAASKASADAYALRTAELDKLTVDQLKALAADAGHDLGDATKKADIIEAIQAVEKAS